MRYTLLIAFFSLSMTLAQAPQDPGTASIEGIVVNSLTNQPVDEAQLTLQSVRGGPAIPPIKTGPDGRFAFRDLKAGSYGLDIAGNAYVRMNYGQKVFPAGYGGAPGEGSTITLTAGEAAKNLSVRLIPTGTITGRIRDVDTRQPVAGVPVRLRHYVYLPDGERSLEELGMTQTNDRGEYRLYFVTPMRYYIQAGGPLSSRPIGGPARASANDTTGTYSAMFYPGNANVTDATIVDLKPGAEVGGIDVFVGKPQDLYRISGRILDSATGQPPPSANVSLYRRADTRWQHATEMASNYRAADGSFEFRGVGPGSYLVRVEARSAAQRLLQTLPQAPGTPRVVTVAYQAPAPRAPEPRGYAVKVVPVTVAGVDVGNLAIPVSPGVSLSGRITIEGRSFSTAELNRLRVYINSPDNLLQANSPLSVVNGETTFQLNDVTPGEYRASLTPLPQSLYLKEARFGGVDALANPFQVSDRETAQLTLGVSANTASLEGPVTTEKNEVLADAVVVLVPERNRERRELFRSVATDRAGHFVFPGVPPGAYKVIAWEALQPFSYFDPDVLRIIDQRGRAIQLQESARTSVSITAIPAN
jgi:hypothetical protein